MGWRNPPPTWLTLPPVVDESKDAAGPSAWIHRPAGAPAQIAKRSQGRREPSRASGSRPQPRVSSEVVPRGASTTKETVDE
jgi:hypothetical protein